MYLSNNFIYWTLRESLLKCFWPTSNVSEKGHNFPGGGREGVGWTLGQGGGGGGGTLGQKGGGVERGEDGYSGHC